jgi:hypothetical protein
VARSAACRRRLTASRTLELRGSYDNIAPLTVSGQLNPLSADPYLDLQADVKGIEMTSLSPYSASMPATRSKKASCRCSSSTRSRTGSWSPRTGCFSISSPSASGCQPGRDQAAGDPRRRPAQEPNGEIDINLPIAGSLDDPQFSIGGLVVAKVIVNLLVKAVTSPFALLGSVFGGGEELSTIDFESARRRSRRARSSASRISAKALLDRPALKLEIEGRADRRATPRD